MVQGPEIGSDDAKGGTDAVCDVFELFELLVERGRALAPPWVVRQAYVAGVIVADAPRDF